MTDNLTIAQGHNFSIKNEPIATLTNAAFLVFAIIIAFKGATGSTALVAGLTLLAIGSAAFHGFGSKEGGLAHVADVGSLYVVAGVVVYHTWNMEAWILIAAMVVASGLMLTIGRLSAAIPVAAATLLVFAGIGINHNWEAAFIPLGLAVAGYGAQLLSERYEKKGNKLMDDILHGIWHILIAAAVYTAWVASTF